jgi:hypothetical protein
MKAQQKRGQEAKVSLQLAIEKFEKASLSDPNNATNMFQYPCPLFSFSSFMAHMGKCNFSTRQDEDDF